MAKTAIRRLENEYNRFLTNPITGIDAEPDDGDVFNWTATITGPPGTAYEGQTMTLRLSFSLNYPFDRPIVRFVTPVYHPNIGADGDISLSLFEDFRPGTALLDGNWSPGMTIEKILLSILSLLSEPITNSIVNLQAARLWKLDKDEYKKEIVRVMGEPEV